MEESKKEQPKEEIKKPDEIQLPKLVANPIPQEQKSEVVHVPSDLRSFVSLSDEKLGINLLIADQSADSEVLSKRAANLFDFALVRRTQEIKMGLPKVPTGVY